MALRNPEIMGIDYSEVVVFGDGGNDIEMLRQAGFSFVIKRRQRGRRSGKIPAGSSNREGVLDVIDKVLKHSALFDQ